jgi:SPP1 family predicted phage head-tail adaptor
MRAGRLRHRLTLQSKTESRDAYGSAIIAWTTEATVWGAIEPLSGREYPSQGTLQAEAKVRIVLRYRTGIIPAWRFKHDGLYYDIVDVINERTRDRMIHLMTREGVSDDGSDAVTQNVVNSGVLVVNSGIQVVST